MGIWFLLEHVEFEFSFQLLFHILDFFLFFVQHEEGWCRVYGRVLGSDLLLKGLVHFLLMGGVAGDHLGFLAFLRDGFLLWQEDDLVGLFQSWGVGSVLAFLHVLGDK